MFNFEKLEVWHKAVVFAKVIYKHSRTFPGEERFGLTNQIRRAAVSISSNIAEGSARPAPDFIKFLGYATGSLYEVVTQAVIAYQHHYLDETSFQEIYSDAEQIARMISGLRRSLGE
ncbi:four helix bundle protein [Horticoccus sp. 23ND18S-11]|uniref:four helix bundle protein n=1 Tax=Horticoccus sp. 23ND18S-11 TaxID=3391832 RepID=UPI0039C98360